MPVWPLARGSSALPRRRRLAFLVLLLSVAVLAVLGVLVLLDLAALPSPPATAAKRSPAPPAPAATAAPPRRRAEEEDGGGGGGGGQGPHRPQEPLHRLEQACPGVHDARYGELHRRYLRAFAPATEQAPTAPQALPLNGTLVFVGRAGGLGNRLRGWTTAFYLAVLLNRAFFVHWPEPSVVDSYWEPTDWFDWRVGAAPPRLRAALLAAAADPRQWRHSEQRAVPWDARAHFSTSNFTADLSREHEAIVLLHDGALELVRNPHTAAHVDRWLGAVVRAHAASGQSQAHLQGRLFACAMHLLTRRSRAYNDAVAHAARSLLWPASAWANGTAVDAGTVPPWSPPTLLGTAFPGAIHLRLGDRDSVVVDQGVRHEIASHFFAALAVTAAQERSWWQPRPPDIFLASDHVDAVMPLLPSPVAQHVYAQAPSNVSIATGLHVNIRPSQVGLARTMVDFALLSDAAVLIASFRSSFSRAAARLAWLDGHSNQTAYRVAPCLGTEAAPAPSPPACPILELSKATAYLPTLKVE